MGRIDYTKLAGGQGRVKRDGEGSQDDELGSSQHDSDVSGFSLRFAICMYIVINWENRLYEVGGRTRKGEKRWRGESGGRLGIEST